MKTSGILKDIGIDYKTRKTIVSFVVDSKAENVEKLMGKKLSLDVKQYREKRSLDANAYYWQLLTKVAEAVKVSKPFAHNQFLRRYGQIEQLDGKAVYVVIPDTEESENRVGEAETYHLKPTSEVKEGRDGQMYRTYMMLRGSSDYDTKEMSELISGLVSEAKDLGIETLPPDEINRMMEMWERKK